MPTREHPGTCAQALVESEEGVDSHGQAVLLSYNGEGVLSGHGSPNMSSLITKASLGQNGVQTLPTSCEASGVESVLVERLVMSPARGLMPSARQVASHAERSRACASLLLWYCGEGVQTGNGDVAGDISVSTSSRHKGSSGQNFERDAGAAGGSAMLAVDGGGAIARPPL